MGDTESALREFGYSDQFDMREAVLATSWSILAVVMGVGMVLEAPSVASVVVLLPVLGLMGVKLHEGVNAQSDPEVKIEPMSDLRMRIVRYLTVGICMLWSAAFVAVGRPLMIVAFGVVAVLFLNPVWGWHCAWWGVE